MRERQRAQPALLRGRCRARLPSRARSTAGCRRSARPAWARRSCRRCGRRAPSRRARARGAELERLAAAAAAAPPRAPRLRGDPLALGGREPQVDGDDGRAEQQAGVQRLRELEARRQRDRDPVARARRRAPAGGPRRSVPRRAARRRSSFRAGVSTAARAGARAAARSSHAPVFIAQQASLRADEHRLAARRRLLHRHPLRALDRRRTRASRRSRSRGPEVRNAFRPRTSSRSPTRSSAHARISRSA